MAGQGTVRASTGYSGTPVLWTRQQLNRPSVDVAQDPEVPGRAPQSFRGKKKENQQLLSPPFSSALSQRLNCVAPLCQIPHNSWNQPQERSQWTNAPRSLQPECRSTANRQRDELT